MVYKKLFQWFWNLTFQGETSVHEVCKIDNHALAELVFEHSENISAIDTKGDQAIHVAALHGKTSILATLLSKGCSSNRKVFLK